MIKALLAALGSLLITGCGADMATRQRPVLLVVAGQSNVGHNNLNGLQPESAASTVWWWHEDSGSHYSGAGSADRSGTTNNAFVPQSVVSVTSPPKLCVDVGVTDTLTMAGRDVQTIRVWQGSTTLYSDWAPPPLSGARGLFQVLDREGQSAVAHPSFELGADYDVWLLWVQGEADASSELHSNSYEERLWAFWEAFRSLPWVRGHGPRMVLLQLNEANGRPFAPTVRKAQETFSGSRSDVVLLNADDLSLIDQDHYGSRDIYRIGVRAAGVILGE